MKKFIFITLASVIAITAFTQQPDPPSNSSETRSRPGQTRSTGFGEKVAGGLQTGAPALATAVSSVSGVSKPGGAVSSSYAAGRLSMTPATTRQTRGANSGEKVRTGNPLYESGNQSGVNPMHGASNAARPGTPIGGIVVKGGKNPGGNMTITISNERGVFELMGLEPGSYQFTLIPPNASQGRGISEKGVKRQEPAQTETRTYDGIVVKGGKNPGETLTRLQVSENGEIRFEVLEAGNYQFMIQVAEDTHPNSTDQEKVVEKATSGLKDTLKTNV